MLDLSISESNDLRYSDFIDVEDSCDCEAAGCDSICRCSVITGVTLSLKTPSNYHACFKTIYVGSNDLLERSLWYWWFKFHGHLLRCGWEAEGGYYGEELNRIWLVSDSSAWDPERFDKLSVKEKIHWLLTEEYGSVLPEIAKVEDWEAKCFFTRSIKQSSNNQLVTEQVNQYGRIFDSFALNRMRDKASVFQNETADFMPLCMPVKNTNHLRIVDGRHRFEAFMKTQILAQDGKKYPPVFLWVICPKGTDLV